MECRATRLSKEAIIFSELHEINFEPASTPRRGGVFAFFGLFVPLGREKGRGPFGLRPPFGPPPFFSSSGDEKSKKRLRKLRPSSGFKGGPGRRAAGAGAATGQDPGGIAECHCGLLGGPRGTLGPGAGADPWGALRARCARAARARENKRARRKNEKKSARFFF